MSVSLTRSRLARFSPRVLCVVAAVLAVVATPAQAQPEGEKQRLLSATDNEEFVINYFPTKAKGSEAMDAPVLILIHDSKADRLVWEKRRTNTESQAPMVEILGEEGYAVVTLDMRGQGENKDAGRRGRPNFKAMLGDLEAIKNFLLTEHQSKKLNINKLGIVAVDDFAPVATTYADIDWSKPDYDDAITASERTPRGRDVRTLVLFSPALASGGLKTANTLRELTAPSREVAICIFYGESDPRDRNDSEKLISLIGANDKADDNLFAQKIPTKFHGSNLFGQKQFITERQMLDFLDKNLKQLDSPWRDRRSKLER